MKRIKGLDKSEIIERGMNALYKELGPVEARRFITTVHEMPHEDSVKRHRRRQAKLDPQEFAREIMEAQRG